MVRRPDFGKRLSNLPGYDQFRCWWGNYDCDPWERFTYGTVTKS